MSPMFTLPEYDVVIWHKVESSPPGLHWGFKTSHEAIEFAESLLEIAASEDVTVLCVNSTRDPNFVSKVYKDMRIFETKKT